MVAIKTLNGPLEYLLYNTYTGEYIESLPLYGVTFGGGPVNNAGTFNGKLKLSDPGLDHTQWATSTKPNFATLIIDLNGTIVWGGVISGRKATFDGNSGHSLEIDAQEGWAWWNHWVQATDYSSPPYSGITGIAGDGMPIWNKPFLQLDAGATYCPGYGNQPYIWDPMLMAAQLIYDCYNEPYQGIWGGWLDGSGGFQIMCNGIRVDSDHGHSYLTEAEMSPFVYTAGVNPTPTGRRTPESSYISVNFPFTSLMTLSSMLSQFTGMGYTVGFDGAVDFSYIAGKYSRLVATANLSFPRRGSLVNFAEWYSVPTFVSKYLLLDLSSAHSWVFPEDGTGQANICYETGGNQDIVVLENVYTDPPISLNPYGGYVPTHRVGNQSNLNSPNPTKLLQQMASSDLNLFSWPPVAPQIVVDAFNPECGLGSYVVGDNCMVNIPELDADDNVFDPRFPTGLYNEWRISTYSAQIGDEGESLITFTLDTPPVPGQGRNEPTLQGA
jgi:hypothetical protein